MHEVVADQPDELKHAVTPGQNYACGENSTQSARRGAKIAKDSLGASRRGLKDLEIFLASFAFLRALCVELRGPLGRSNGSTTASAAKSDPTGVGVSRAITIARVTAMGRLY